MFVMDDPAGAIQQQIALATTNDLVSQIHSNYQKAFPSAPIDNSNTTTPPSSSPEGPVVLATPLDSSQGFQALPVGYPIPISAPNLTELQAPAHFAMDQNWSSGGGFYNHYTPEALRSADKQTSSPSTNLHSYEEPGHRRANTVPHTSTYLPASHASFNGSNNGNMNLPPFNQTFYPQYPPNSNNHGSSQSAPSNVHTLPHNVGYSPHISMSAPSSNNYHYPLTSPLGLNDSLSTSGHRAPPPHSYNESPRIPGWSSSPGLHHFSPTSPTTGLNHGMNPPSASTSSSSFPSLAKTPATLPKGRKRSSTSTSRSNGSWDEADRYMPTSTEMDHKSLDSEPWGMPAEIYKALNPKDKKQVRNRIGARRFRAKKKENHNILVSNLESAEKEIAALRAQNDQQRNEINDLRQRLGLPRVADPNSVGLGLVVGANGNGTVPASADGWGQSKLEPSA